MPAVRVPGPRDATVPISVAAQMLGVSDMTVRRWADAGRLPVHHKTAAGHRRFLLSDVDKLRDALDSGAA